MQERAKLGRWLYYREHLVYSVAPSYNRTTYTAIAVQLVLYTVGLSSFSFYTKVWVAAYQKLFILFMEKNRIFILSNFLVWTQQYI